MAIYTNSSDFRDLLFQISNTEKDILFKVEYLEKNLWNFTCLKDKEDCLILNKLEFDFFKQKLEDLKEELEIYLVDIDSYHSNFEKEVENEKIIWFLENLEEIINNLENFLKEEEEEEEVEQKREDEKFVNKNFKDEENKNFWLEVFKNLSL